jgi:Ca-activated chloride channel family protein
MLHSPWAILLLLLVPLLIVVQWKRRNTAAIKYSSLSKFEQCPVSLRQRLRPILFLARLACIILLIIALARPRKGMKVEQISTEGVAMMIVVDRSGSMGEAMLYKGQQLNRLEAVKKVVADFIAGDGKDYQGRMGDMIGLVTYARYADTQCPLVRGNTIITDFLKETELVTQRAEDGTAIGDGIAVAAARLQKAEKQIIEDQARLSPEQQEDPGFTIKSKVIVLLTDGMNNAGQYHPLETAKLAAEWGIKIYTIGIGSQAQNRQRGFFSMMGPSLDERLLKQIADETGGFYARADNAEQLREIYKKIDELEKSEVNSVEYVDYAEQFSPWAMAALALLLFEIMAGTTVFRKIP